VRRRIFTLLVFVLALPLFGSRLIVDADGVDASVQKALTKEMMRSVGSLLPLSDEDECMVHLTALKDDGDITSLSVVLSYHGMTLEERLSVPSGKGVERRLAKQLSSMLEGDVGSLFPPIGTISLGSDYLYVYGIPRQEGVHWRTGMMFRAEGGGKTTGLLSVQSILENTVLLEVRSNHGLYIGQSLSQTHALDVELYGLYGFSGYGGGEMVLHFNHPYPFRLLGAVSVFSTNPMMLVGLEALMPFSVLGNGWFLQNSSLSASMRVGIGFNPMVLATDATLTYRLMVTAEMHIAVAGRLLYYPEWGQKLIWQNGYAVLVGGGWSW